MKILIITVLFLFMASSCTDDYVGPNIDTNCSLSNQTHTKSAALKNLLDANTKDGFVGMTVLVDDPKEGQWLGSSGYASIEENIKMNPCHIHHTASLYKTFIATVVMQLVDENEIALDDKLSDYISLEIIDKIPNGNSITILDLLQQRTGIPDIFEVEFITDFFNNQTKTYSIEELLEYVYVKEPLSEAGTTFQYSDANYSLLTLLINEIEGNHIEALKSRIFEPLNLNHTYFLEKVSEIPAALSNSYWDRYNDGKYENNSDVQTSLTVGLRGSDGIVSSAEDLMKFMQALAKGNLVNGFSQMINCLDVPAAIQKNEVYSGYGLGIMRVNISGENWYGHFGNHIGSGAIMLYNLDRDITIVALQNTGTFFSDEIKGKFFFQLLGDIEEILF